MSAAGRRGEGPGGAGPGEPSEEELRAAYEAELSRITTTDMIAQAAVSLLNIGARRLGAGGEAPAPSRRRQRDLEQVRDAIDGARALLEILERRIPQELAPLRDALSRLQMAYAREISRRSARPAPADGAAGEPGAGGAARRPPPPASAGSGEGPPGPGRRSPAAGCGCPAAERAAGARRSPGCRRPVTCRRAAGTIDCARVCAG